MYICVGKNMMVRDYEGITHFSFSFKGLWQR
jgi:hypothetical protein